MWVKLRTRKSIVRKGAIVHYRPGDWVDVGRHVGESWVAGGDAEIIDPELLAESVASTTGVVIRGHLGVEQRKILDNISGLKFAFFDKDWIPTLPFTETMIWDTRLTLRFDLILAGFELLKKWQLVVPLFDYEMLASSIGTTKERELTEAVIKDLRVPLRDTRLMFVRRCSDTRLLMDEWCSALNECKEERLAFLQAMYKVKPLVCDVPCSWVGR